MLRWQLSEKRQNTINTHQKTKEENFNKEEHTKYIHGQYFSVLVLVGGELTYIFDRETNSI